MCGFRRCSLLINVDKNNLLEFKQRKLEYREAISQKKTLLTWQLTLNKTRFAFTLMSLIVAKRCISMSGNLSL